MTDTGSDPAQALDVFNVPLDGVQLVEASAGTGKTWAICGLVLRLLLERGLPVQQVLVVTFTNAATAELRERLRQRLLDVLAGLEAPPALPPPPPPAPATAPPPGDRFVPELLAGLQARGIDTATLRQRLQLALQNFDEAAVFTIHGFCQRALADTPMAAQMPLQQTLLADDSALLAEAVHDFWRRHVAGGTDPALAAHLLARGDSPARWVKLLRRQLARPLSRLLWPADIDAHDDAPDAPPDNSTQRRQRLQHAFDAARSAWAVQRASALAVLEMALPQLHGTYIKAAHLAAAGPAWDALLAHSQPPAEVALKDLACLGSSLLALRTKKNQATPRHPFFDTAQALLDALAGEARALQLARLRLLRALLHEAAQRQRQAKRAQRVVAFDDMLANLHQRLHGSAGPGLAAALRQRFPAALIDEFQDTDPLQWAVFRTIYATPSAPDAAPAPPLFLVGDPKQAIYSFRHADLHTYLQARSEARACWTLSQNQRAVPALIHALNTLFGQHRNAFLQPGLHYQPVHAGTRPRSVLADSSGQARAALQVWTLPRPDGQPLLKAEAMRQAAASCAGEITRLLAEAQAGRITLDGQPLQASHIAVLVRSHAQGSSMRQALAALGVGSVELSQASVFSAPDADELERVLAAMLQPGRDGLLKAALATRWHGWTADAIHTQSGDELAWLAQVQAYARFGVLWRKRGIGVALQAWRAWAGVAQRLLAAPDGARRLTNLLHLGELLHQASAEQPSPEALLRWLQTSRDAASADDAHQLRLESDQHLVQIVTIHKSKGLEYPLVFCPFLWNGRAAAGADALDGVPGHDDEGRAVLDFRAGLDDAFDPAAAKAQARLEAAAETLRLVYVALTRAVHRCHLVVGGYACQTGAHRSTKEAGRNLLNWLLLGDGLQGSDWYDDKRKPATPAEIDAAWHRLQAAAALPALAGASIAPAGASIAPAGASIAPAGAGGPLPLAVQLLPAPRRQPLPADAAGQAPLSALPAPAVLPRGWWIGSFSGLTEGALAPTHGDGALAGAEDGGVPAGAEDGGALAGAGAPGDSSERPWQPRAAADHDTTLDSAEPTTAETPDDAAPAAAAPLPADDPLRFPRGTLAGVCMHAAFELADFGDPASWAPAIGRALQQHAPAGTNAQPALAAMLQRTLHNVLATPLPVGTATPLLLQNLRPAQTVAEMEFHLHAPDLQAAALNRLLAAHGVPAPQLGFGTLQGHLKGFIDLVLQHEGRWYVLDWKSNHLGDNPADYAAERLHAAMTAHHYHLQSLLYSLALQRWLQLRLPGYAHARHFGGALYLFVRGLRPGWLQPDGRPCGLHLQRFDAALLDSLQALLDGDAPGAAP